MDLPLHLALAPRRQLPFADDAEKLWANCAILAISGDVRYTSSKKSFAEGVPFSMNQTTCRGEARSLGRVDSVPARKPIKMPELAPWSKGLLGEVYRSINVD